MIIIKDKKKNKPTKQKQKQKPLHHNRLQERFDDLKGNYW